MENLIDSACIKEYNEKCKRLKGFVESINYISREVIYRMNMDFLNTDVFWKYGFAILIAPLILFLLKERWKNKKSITVEAEEMFRIGKSGILEAINEKTEYYSNPYYHRVTLKSKNIETISAIELYDIEIENKEFSEIRFDVGFDEKSQKYILIGINNGDTTIKTEKAVLNINMVERINFRKKLFKQIVIPRMVLKSGEVLSIEIINLVDYKKEFIQDANLHGLIIEAEINNIVIPSMKILYDRENNIFRGPQLGCGVPRVDDSIIFNLKDNQKCIKKKCSYIIKDVERLGFIIMVEKSCQLKYKVKLYSGRKKIKGHKDNIVNIRIPKYSIGKDNLNGPFYSWILEINPNLEQFKLTFDSISEQKKELIFDTNVLLQMVKKMV